MYYYMFKHSKPLKHKKDKYVNGYGGSRTGPPVDSDEEVVIIDEEPIEDNEDDDAEYYRLKRQQEDKVSKATTKVDKLVKTLESNTPEGYEASTKAAEKFVTYGPESNPIKNEAGWICEYFFGMDIAPKAYTDSSIEPSAEKYFKKSEYFSDWDFKGSYWTVDVKAQSILELGAETPYDERAYYCQLSKFTTKFPKTDVVAIWWGEIDNFDSFVLNRDPPKSWKYFEVRQEDWQKYYYIIEKGYTPEFLDEGEAQILTGLYRKNEHYNSVTKLFEDVRIAYFAPQAGQVKGEQLVFFEKYLSSYP